MGIARRIGIALTATGMALGLAAPASALSTTETDEFLGKLKTTYTDPATTNDGDPYDFDIVTKAAIVTGATGDLATLSSFTLFAPNDRAFEVLARDLGLLGKNYRFGASVDETRVFTVIADAAAKGAVDLKDVLLYHVVPGAKLTGKDVLAGPFTQRVTMANEDKLGVTVLSRSPRFPVILLGDRDGKPFSDFVVRSRIDAIQTQNTVVHGISDVLLPPAN